MWRSKKVIIIAVLVAVLVFGSVGGVVLANAGDDTNSTPTTTIFDRVTAILADQGISITAQQLKDAFVQAGGDIQNEAIKSRLDALVAAGKIDQSTADQYFQWWQSRPEGLSGLGIGARNGFFGMGRMRGFREPCFPAEPTEPAQYARQTRATTYNKRPVREGDQKLPLSYFWLDFTID